MNTTLPVQLSDQEIDELAEFLYAKAPTDALSISELHGFLSAVVIGPELVLPNEWLPLIWGNGEEGEPEFADQAHAEHILSLIMRMYNSINDQVRDRPDEYFPIYMTAEEGNEPDIDDWCYGFMIGISLRHEAWQPLLEDEEMGDLLMPLIACAMEYCGDMPEGEAVPAEVRIELAKAIPSLVPVVYACWHQVEEMQPVSPRRTPGRRH
ncbi:uncharacterized protein SAMN05660284_02343 [Formivibrio citricus]|uniref:YecA family protein n=1 Tax=Formivibrio citricus TaxID=83765 RepID=A0A1I5C6A6_9NEIS|nr:UPF0149 family protein [Formivibrio citricus]SFN82356.1 uncharacterized protein SAMN05660284_02343 [Formivibrio citricus]